MSDLTRDGDCAVELSITIQPSDFTQQLSISHSEAMLLENWALTCTDIKNGARLKRIVDAISIQI